MATQSHILDYFSSALCVIKLPAAGVSCLWRALLVFTALVAQLQAGCPICPCGADWSSVTDSQSQARLPVNSSDYLIESEMRRKFGHLSDQMSPLCFICGPNKRVIMYHERLGKTVSSCWSYFYSDSFHCWWTCWSVFHLTDLLCGR